LHLQPELRGPAGRTLPHPPGLPRGGRGDGGARHPVRTGGPDRPHRPSLVHQTRRTAYRRRVAAGGAGLMETFTTHTGIGVPLRRSNVDTDQIIPAQWLKRVARTGFEEGLFSRWREDPAFVLNQEAYAAGSVLVAGPDFGTGSSREHAVWALQQYGFRAVISSRFGDIFRGNSGKGGLLTAQVAQPDVELILKYLENTPGA